MWCIQYVCPGWAGGLITLPLLGGNGGYAGEIGREGLGIENFIGALWVRYMVTVGAYRSGLVGFVGGSKSV